MLKTCLPSIANQKYCKSFRESPSKEFYVHISLKIFKTDKVSGKIHLKNENNSVYSFQQTGKRLSDQMEACSIKCIGFVNQLLYLKKSTVN